MALHLMEVLDGGYDRPASALVRVITHEDSSTFARK